MSNLRRPDRLTVRWLGLVIVGALLPLVLWSQNSGALEDGRGPFRRDGLKVTSRDHLALCIQGISGATVDPVSATSKARDAARRVQSHPSWSLLRIRDDPISVAYGCPSPPVLQPSGALIGRTQRLITTKYVSDASEYRLFIFVMPAVEVQRSFGSDSLYSRVATEETICVSAETTSGQRCDGVTSGVYLTEAELDDPEAFNYAILRGLNLAEPPVDLPSDPAIAPAPLPTPRPSPSPSPSPSVSYAGGNGA